jgi:hypothetical protein
MFAYTIRQWGGRKSCSASSVGKGRVESCACRIFSVFVLCGFKSISFNLQFIIIDNGCCENSFAPLILLVEKIAFIILLSVWLLCKHLHVRPFSFLRHRTTTMGDGCPLCFNFWWFPATVEHSIGWHTYYSDENKFFNSGEHIAGLQLSIEMNHPLFFSFNWLTFVVVASDNWQQTNQQCN